MQSTESVKPVPRYAALWAILTYAFATLTLAWPAFSGRFLASEDSDQYIGGFPVREFASHIMGETGGFALWNPYLYGGMPYVAAMHGDIFYPTFLLRLFLPVDVGLTWGMILHLFLVGCFTYWFLRTIGFSFAASLIGGLAYMLSGQIASLVNPGHDGKLFIGALLPLMLLTLVWGIRDDKKWAWGLLAIVSGLGVLTPHPQLYQYLLLGAGAYGLMLAFGGDVKLSTRQALTRLSLALGAVLLGWLIGAIQFVPVFEYIDWSPRANGKGWEHAVSYSMPPEELVNTFLPQFSGILNDYWGRNFIHFHSEYIGVAVLFLAGAGFWWGRRRDSWFWLGFLIISLLWSLGGYTPFYHLVYNLVPGAKFFRAPSTFFYLVAFAVAIFAARGTERLLTTGFTRRYALGWLGAGVLVVLLAFSGGLRQVFIGLVPMQRMDVFLDPASQSALSVGALRSFFFLFAAAALAHALAGRMVTTRIATIALAAIVLVDLWSVDRLYWRFSPPASELYGSDPIIEYIQAQPEPGRVMALLMQAPPRGRDAFLAGDAYMIHRIRLVTGYHGNQIGRYDRLWGAAEGGRNLLNPVFWQVANVKWFIYNDSIPIHPYIEPVMGPVTNAAGTPVWLYKTRGDYPAAWVVPAIMKQPDEVVEEALKDSRFPVKSVGLFNPDAAVQGLDLTVAPEPLEIRASVPTYEAGHIVVELDAPAPAGSALMVSENYYPGWSVVVDGVEHDVHRANLSMMGIALPEGARRVELSFSSASYERGKMITLLGIALSLLAVAVGVVMQRRTADG